MLDALMQGAILEIIPPAETNCKKVLTLKLEFVVFEFAFFSLQCDI